jgi:uncharacterized protein YdeI (YjbR/CyaY-like superfamily)
MGTRDPRIDAYIARSADFAQPILTHLREVVHDVCPEVEETLKWGAPHFMYKGMLCGMASFKHHCAFGFWKGALVLERGGDRAEEAMGQFGRITAISDLPPRSVLARYIKVAMRLNEEGVKSPTRTKRTKKPLAVPADLSAALRRNAKARTTFEEFSPSHRREYIEWITEAKREETRKKRLATTLEWLAEGKPHNWKYKRS